MEQYSIVAEQLFCLQVIIEAFTAGKAKMGTLARWYSQPLCSVGILHLRQQERSASAYIVFLALLFSKAHEPTFHIAGCAPCGIDVHFAATRVCVCCAAAHIGNPVGICVHPVGDYFHAGNGTRV